MRSSQRHLDQQRRRSAESRDYWAHVAGRRAREPHDLPRRGEELLQRRRSLRGAERPARRSGARPPHRQLFGLFPDGAFFANEGADTLYGDADDDINISGLTVADFAVPGGILAVDAASGGFGGTAGDTVIVIDSDADGTADPGTDEIVALVLGVGVGVFSDVDFVLS